MEYDVSRESQSVWIRLRWLLTVVALGLIALVAYIISLCTVQDTLEKLAHSASEVGARVEAVAERFKKGTITQTFLAQLPELASGGSAKLELATLHSVELFKREDMKTVAWDWLYLGTTVS